MASVQELEKEYIDVVNIFYVFWKQHIYDYPKGFKTYLNDTPMRARLSFNIQDCKWYLI
jgi:hypothetical protein